MRAIILAAGESKRMEIAPKCLLKLSKSTILDFQIGCLTNLGVKPIFVVVGCEKEKIVNHLKGYNNVEVVYNDLFRTTDNAHSLSLALRVADEPVVVLDGDIIFDPRLLRMLLNVEGNALVGDNAPRITEEDSKVMVKDGYATYVGKDVPVGENTVIYASMMKFCGDFFWEFKAEIRKPEYIKSWYSAPLSEVLKRFPRTVRVLLTDGLPRCDIDTPEDLAVARAIYKGVVKWAK